MPEKMNITDITINDWSKLHSLTRINNEIVSYIDTEDGDNTILFLHDFGTNSYSFYKQLQQLQHEYRIVIPDLIGFGFSNKPRNYYFSILDQAQMIIKLLEKLEINSVTVVSQGYGTSVLLEIIAEIQNLNSKIINLNFTNIVLLNGSLTIEVLKSSSSNDLINNTMNTKFNQIGYSYQLFEKNFNLALQQPSKVTTNDIRILWSLMSVNSGQRYLQFVDYTILERKQFAKKWIGALKNTRTNVLIVWGESDITNNKKLADKLHQIVEGSELKLIESCGHFPSLEQPEILNGILEEITKEQILINM